MGRQYAVAAVLCFAVAMVFAGPALAQTDSKEAKQGEQSATAAAQAAVKEAEKQDEESNPVVVMETTKGKIVIELFEKEAPITVENFLKYVNEGFYEGITFHRVIPRFVIQAGGMTADMKRKNTHQPIKNEASNGLKNLRGTLSMARTSDPHSATSQFFINLNDNTSLDYTKTNAGYAVFGKVIRGMDVVDRIAALKTTSKAGHNDVPEQPVTINKAYVQAEKAEEKPEQDTEGKSAEKKESQTKAGGVADKKATQQKAADN